MHIEDLIILLSMRANMNPYDSQIIHSFHDQISSGSGFTEKQEALAVKILKRHIYKLNDLLGKDVSQYIANPSFRLTRRTVNPIKSISVIPDSTYGKVIKLEFPFNEEILNKIKKVKGTLHFANWDRDKKAWFFSCDERTINFLSNLVENSNFIADDEFWEYVRQTNEIKKTIENHLPVLTVNDSKFNFINVPDNVTQPDTTDIIEGLFLARQIGIQTWDDKVDSLLTNVNINPVVKKFLDSVPSMDFEFLLEDNIISDISDIIKYLQPCIFIIPGGSEIEKMTESLALLDSIGIDHADISVLFRLPKETGDLFNKFVRENHLNNPVDKNTKIVFISSKIPKTILDSDIKFNSVVNFNFYNVHYTIREFINNHHNVIHILNKKPQRILNFAGL